MINICNLRDVNSILFYKKANAEIVKIVRDYFNKNDEVYYRIVKFHWYDKTQAKFHFNIAFKKRIIKIKIRKISNCNYSRFSKRRRKNKFFEIRKRFGEKCLYGMSRRA